MWQSGHEQDCWSQTVCGGILALLTTISVTLGRLHNPCYLSFHVCKMGIIISTYTSFGCCKDKMSKYVNAQTSV